MAKKKTSKKAEEVEEVDTPVETPEEVTQAAEVEEDKAAPAEEPPADIHVARLFRGQRITKEESRTVGTNVLHTITLASGNVMDLTDEEYEKEVTFE